MLHMLGTYRVEQKLAEGGMGSVFLASAPDGRKVVLKVPHAQDRDAAIALADEARTGARLRHPAIIETLDFFVDKGVSVLVVAHIDGPSLYDLRRAGPLPGSAVAEIGVQLAGALHTIHTACDEAGRPLRMLHRDISPNNVLVDRSGQVRLIDLGIARSVDRKQKATSAGMVKGTLRYLAPEILRGGDHDVATDLWALGLTLWEAAMGRYAVAGDPMNTMRAAMAGDILALGDGERVDSDVLDVIQALVCPAEQRMQNAKAAGAVLTRLANKRPGGRDALAEAVAVVATALFEDERTDNVDITLTKDRGMMAPASRPETPDVTAVLPRDEDVASVFTTTTPRDQSPRMHRHLHRRLRRRRRKCARRRSPRPSRSRRCRAPRKATCSAWRMRRPRRRRRRVLRRRLSPSLRPARRRRVRCRALCSRRHRRCCNCLHRSCRRRRKFTQRPRRFRRCRALHPT